MHHQHSPLSCLSFPTKSSQGFNIICKFSQRVKPSHQTTFYDALLNLKVVISASFNHIRKQTFQVLRMSEVLDHRHGRGNMTTVKYWGNPYVTLILPRNVWEGTMRHAATLPPWSWHLRMHKYRSVAILLTVVSSGNTKEPFLMPTHHLKTLKVVRIVCENKTFYHTLTQTHSVFV